MHLYIVQFHFHDELVYDQLLQYEYQNFLQEIFCPLLNIQYANQGKIFPKDYPISLYDFPVPLSKVQSQKDFSFLCQLLLLHLLVALQQNCLKEQGIYQVLKHQNKFPCLFHIHSHFLLFL